MDRPDRSDRPALLTVDDDPDVLRAIERDLRRHYGREYRVLRADSAQAALGAIDELRRRDEPVALLLADQRMPRMNGVEFLEQAMTRVPDAKRVLLTAYADTEAAIRAINTVKLDHYLLKPWDPPEEQLYPVLDDLLDDWKAGFRPPYRGLRVLGHRWLPASHEVREFLARNQVPYRWLDVETDPEAQRLIEAEGAEGAHLPLLIFADGTRLEAPSLRDVAEKVGLTTQAKRPFYDLIIAGGGPAGLAAAVYGASEGLHTVLIEREAPGGQAGQSSRIENYLGFPVGLSGADLTRRAVAQATRFGVEIVTPQEVCGVRLEDAYRHVTLADGTEISCHALIIATGVSYRRLEAPGIERLTGAGCTTARR
jgi:thioredoxin reductase (NADPH)